jgi:1,4-alpha-glucan branching enzyme
MSFDIRSFKKSFKPTAPIARPRRRPDGVCAPRRHDSNIGRRAIDDPRARRHDARMRFARIILLALALGIGILRSVLAQEPGPMGVTIEPGGVRVRVWAPNAHRVEIIGEFNNWKAMGSERLAREGASGVWSTLLHRGLPRGAYRFLINGALHRRDPYGRAVAPDEKSSLFYNPAAFDWTGDAPANFPLDDLVIYELHVGAFFDPDPRDGQPGRFVDVLRRLDHLQELGVNVLQLLPVHEFYGRHSWGYNPSDPFAVEQAYGGPDALKSFIKECRRRGFAVHLDIVHNHYGPENLDLLRFDGVGGPHTGGIYFYEQSGLDMTPWGPRVRFDEPMVRRYIRDNAMMWLEEYRVDGFRWDSTLNIRAYNDGRNPIPAGARMLEDINREIRARFPHVHSIAEDSLGIGNFHASWDYEFHHTVMPELKRAANNEARVGVIAEALSAQHGMPRVVYVDNHDEAGKLNGQVRIASDIDPGNPGSDRARKIAQLGAVLTFTAPGIPLLFMGNEFLENGAFHEDRPLDWTKRQRFAGVVALHRDLIRLRRNLDGVGAALKGANIAIPVVDDVRKTLAYWRWNDAQPADRMVVVINFSNLEQANVVVPFPSEGPWVTRLHTDWTRYGGTVREDATSFNFRGVTPRASLTLPPHSARIFCLAPGAAAHQRPVAPPPVERAGAALQAGGFSLYASIRAVGRDQNGRAFEVPLKRSGARWEGVLQLTNVAGGALRLVANEDGVIYWGVPQLSLDRIPFEAVAERLGDDLRIETALNGRYRIRFDEESRMLSIEPASEPVPPPASAPRRWTDARGRAITARFVALRGDTVTLERADGRLFEIKLSSLSPGDQAAAREAAARLAP